MYVLYNKNTGKIKCKLVCSLKSVLHSLTDTIDFIQYTQPFDINKYYCPEGIIKVKPNMDITYNNLNLNVGDTIEITNIPEGTNINISGIDYGICNDGSIQVPIQEPDMYKVQLTNFPYLPVSLEYYVN